MFSENIKNVLNKMMTFKYLGISARFNFVVNYIINIFNVFVTI